MAHSVFPLPSSSYMDKVLIVVLSKYQNSGHVSGPFRQSLFAQLPTALRSLLFDIILPPVPHVPTTFSLKWFNWLIKLNSEQLFSTCIYLEGFCFCIRSEHWLRAQTRLSSNPASCSHKRFYFSLQTLLCWFFCESPKRTLTARSSNSYTGVTFVGWKPRHKTQRSSSLNKLCDNLCCNCTLGGPGFRFFVLGDSTAPPFSHNRKGCKVTSVLLLSKDALT